MSVGILTSRIYALNPAVTSLRTVSVHPVVQVRFVLPPDNALLFGLICVSGPFILSMFLSLTDGKGSFLGIVPSHHLVASRPMPQMITLIPQDIKE